MTIMMSYIAGATPTVVLVELERVVLLKKAEPTHVIGILVT